MGFCIGVCTGLNSGGLGVGVEETGRPLEDHPNWELKINELGGESQLGWGDFGNIIVAFTNTPPGGEMQCLKLGGYHAESAVFSANVTYVPPETEANNTTLFLSKFDDNGNIIGCRANNGEYQIVERFGGTWTTLAVGGVPAAGFWELKILGDMVALWVDGVEVLTATTSVIDAGYWGISEHEWNHDGIEVMNSLSVVIIHEIITPCMTGNTSPYGEMSACCQLGDYDPWKGMNCTASDGGDAWCVDIDTPMPVWIQWKFDEATPMVPAKLRIKPRTGMEPVWYDEHNPEEIRVYLIQAGDVLVEVAHFDNLDWNDGSYRDFNISTSEAGIGIRIEVVRTGSSDANGGLGHTCIGYFKVLGVIAKPSEITDFSASDDQTEQVTMTFSEATGTPPITYELVIDGTRQGYDITSGYVLAVAGGGTADYSVIAKNVVGETPSNVDSGTALEQTPPTAITDFNASDDEADQITCTWSDAGGNPEPTYELYIVPDTLVDPNVTSPATFSVPAGSTYDLFVRAVNPAGTADSNIDTGTAIRYPMIIKLYYKIDIILPLSGNVDVMIDWGDGSPEEHFTTDFPQHNYPDVEMWVITITGTFDRWSMSDQPDESESFGEVIQLGDCGVKSFEGAFENCDFLTAFKASPCNTSQVTNMAAMFRGCVGFTNIAPDLIGMDTSSVTNMSEMFYFMDELRTAPDVSGFDTSLVTNMSLMFSQCTVLRSPPDLSGLDTSLVTNMTEMFDNMMYNETDFIPRFGLENFNIQSLETAITFFGGRGLTIEAYDDLLIAWAAQAPNIQNDVYIDFYDSVYTLGSQAETARGVLVNDYGWIINDGGGVDNLVKHNTENVTYNSAEVTYTPSHP